MFHDPTAPVAQVASDAAVVAVVTTPTPSKKTQGVPASPPGTPKPVTHAPEPTPTPVAPARPTATPTVVDDAAKHGVIIGKNVTIGPNVVIGGTTAPPRSAHPIDYDPKHLDATTYAPKALALARAVYADVGFVRFDMVAVYPDGHADLTLTDDSASYLFRSPSHSARPSDVPANLPVSIPCYVEVTVGPKDIQVRARDMDPTDPTCKWPLRRLPTCTVTHVWDAAKLAGAKPNTIAKVAFLEDGKWFFDNEYAGDGIVESFADKCP